MGTDGSSQSLLNQFQSVTFSHTLHAYHPSNKKRKENLNQKVTEEEEKKRWKTNSFSLAFVLLTWYVLIVMQHPIYYTCTIIITFSSWHDKYLESLALLMHKK